eukprot:MONOS_4008.1-p1 / transcript=MONOS_4008.1 / gene=MONOS_4008 / organism=Monocercomonoides_exilis_PA203 / gene_product=unspecified product / transcript_product=unspecified product / location=Mono_scaffold00101:18604-19182(-) / protein_length=193 / sequence_SO=supercontig / SO=protein_coding / is_pseudo=false
MNLIRSFMLYPETGDPWEWGRGQFLEEKLIGDVGSEDLCRGDVEDFERKGEFLSHLISSLIPTHTSEFEKSNLSRRMPLPPQQYLSEGMTGATHSEYFIPQNPFSMASPQILNEPLPHHSSFNFYNLQSSNLPLQNQNSPSHRRVHQDVLLNVPQRSKHAPSSSPSELLKEFLEHAYFVANRERWGVQKHHR